MPYGLLSLAGALIAALPLLLTCVFVVEVAVGLPRARRSVKAMSPQDVVIVTPAHDESAVIGQALAALAPALGGPFRLLVVADNCADDTAALANGAGAGVVERHDHERRGKGFALAFARDHLRQDPPQAVIVLDADCRIDRASLEALAAATLGGRPAQAINLLIPDLRADPKVQVSNFAFMVKNLVRQRGLNRLAGRANLTGTGMAMPWSIFEAAHLATADIVEDLKLGLDLAASGRPARFVEDATVWSAASSTKGTLRQRTRWEGGYLATALRRGPAAIGAALRAGRPRDLWAGLSLLVPPLTLLVAIDMAALATLALLSGLGATNLPLILLEAAVAALVVAVVLAWVREGRAFLSTGAALRAPLYLFWKLPLYLGLLKARPQSWIRAGR